MSWKSGRPLYHRLPLESGQYQENPACDWMSQPWDKRLMEIHEAIANVERDHINPATAKPEALDWLAQHYGFTEEYWDPQWPDGIKRSLISNAFTWIWPNKGRIELLEYLLALFTIQARVYINGSFLADINVAGDRVGGVALEYFILMPLSSEGYLRSDDEWKLAEKLNRLFMPIFCESRLCYDHFYADFSVAGDPVF